MSTKKLRKIFGILYLADVSRNVIMNVKGDDIMSNIKISDNKIIAKIKPMHAVNNGPIVANEDDQTRGNFKSYKALKIPYARNHDASFCSSYGGNYAVDVNFIFPDFDADENDPASYDFACTDKHVKEVFLAGTKVFYRLGTRIEHEIKKHNTLPPKDFLKWAKICEHIIKHYTEGWANGFNYDIEYWEIWNEANLVPEDADNKPTWGGTDQEFFEFYDISSRYLKEKFPHLKIGGPAFAGIWNDWIDKFFSYITREGVSPAPLDFFSWHLYEKEPSAIMELGEKIHNKLVEFGYENAEEICNEWNYVKGWTDEFVYSIQQIISQKGAAFTAATMIMGQNSTLDMMMYYDFRPCCFNGAFDYYTLKPMAPYYTFVAFSELYQSDGQTEAICDDDDIYILSAVKDGKKIGMMTYYGDEITDNKKIHIELGTTGKFNYKLLDKDNMYVDKSSDINSDGSIDLVIKPFDVIYFEV